MQLDLGTTTLTDVVAASVDELALALGLRDDDGVLQEANQAYLAFFGAVSPEQLIGTDLERVEFPTEVVEPGVSAFRRLDGRIVWGRVVTHGRLEQIIDVTAQRRDRIDRRHRSTHDELTGLPNRQCFFSQLEAALANEGAAVMMIDIDRFRILNDSHGHPVGDDALRQIADRLRVAVRPSDVVCRVGGDEFAIIIPGRPPVFEVVALANRVLEALDGPVLLGRLEVFATASAGIAFPKDDDLAHDLVRHAEVALYRAKAKGRNRHEIFDDATRLQVAERSQYEAELRRAVADDQLEVHFQPEVDLVTGEILGAEALVRWNHDERGLVTAGEFIELAEATGEIHRIGERVMSIATAAGAEWNDDASLPSLIMRVNLSPRELDQPFIVERIARTISRVGIDPGQLCLEVTETALMVDFDEAMLRLERLSALGVRIAIDDFGTGFSSLRDLRRFPVDVLKIDRSFVAGIASDDAPIVQSILDLGHRLGLEVVAEGVETEAQRQALIEMGCTRGQGWLFGRAVDAYEFRSQLEKKTLSPEG